MRTRIISSFLGSAIGLVAGTYIGPNLGFEGITQYIVFGLSGLALGNVVSLLIDVFSGDFGSPNVGSTKPDLPNPAGTERPR